MTDADDRRDPLRAAFDDYQPPPKELPTPRPAADVERLAEQTVDVTHYSADADGITRHHERLAVTKPILPKGHSENDR